MKKLYKFFPVFLQNILVTLANNHKYYQKYGAIPLIKPLRKVILNLDISSLNDQNTLDRINYLLKEAVNNVPYYQENKDKYQPISTMEDLKNIPVLKKSTLKKYNDKFISKKSNRFNSYKFRTSGSTGTPLKGSILIKELRARHILILTSFKHQGINYSLPLARFLGANIADENKVYRKDFINNHYLFSIYNLSKKNAEKYYQSLKENKIEILEGYPSTLFSLVKLLKSNNYRLPDVKYVLTTAEKLLDYQKEEIESFFKVKIFDYYGSSEGSAYMFLTKDNYYLNSNKVAYFEIVDDNLDSVTGKSGKMLVTSFTSSYSPLIRYDIGDICTLKEDINEVIKVKEIIGRQDDVFINPDGVEFSRFSLILKYLPNEVQESMLKLHQNSENAELIYVADCSLPLYEFKEFEDKINKALNMNFKIKYKHINNFDKINNGKLSAIKILKNED